MHLLLLMLIDWDKWRPEEIFGRQILERTPAGLTVLYIVGVGILVTFLLVSFIDNFRRPAFVFERELPAKVRKRMTQTIANRSLRVWHVLFVMLSFAVFGFQVYWTYFADDSNEQFQALNYKSYRRNCRASAASLRGWTLTVPANSPRRSPTTNLIRMATSAGHSHSKRDGPSARHRARNAGPRTNAL